MSAEERERLLTERRQYEDEVNKLRTQIVKKDDESEKLKLEMQCQQKD